MRAKEPLNSAHGVSDTAVAIAGSGVDHSVDQTMDPSSQEIALSGSSPGASRSGGSTTTTEIIGTTLAERYLVKRQIGQGGMGAVYEATDTRIGKRVALKVLLEKYAAREAIVLRLKQEAQLASAIGNEHIIDINDIGNTDDGRTFVVMEYLDGESLAECLTREHELPEQRTLRIASQAASALEAAHRAGIVHRDIKPENLFLLKRKDQDFVKVVDFGISKSLRASGAGEEAQRLTQTGMVLGTPLYMSPEQARGDEDLDHRVDLYALGVIMYEAIAGRVPFMGTNYLSVISQVLNEEPKPIREIRPDVSEELEAIVSKAMAKDRTHRYDDASAMLKDITLVLEDPTHSTERAKITGPRKRLAKAARIPRIAWAIGAIGIAIGLVMLAVVLMNGPKTPVAKQPATDPSLVHGDAGVAAVTIDAAPVIAPPTRKIIKLVIKTEPEGAIIYRDAERIGPSPAEIELAQVDVNVLITAQLDGFKDGTTSINPLDRHDGQEIPLKLVKLPKNAPQQHHVPPGGGSAALHGGTAGGELGGYPPPDNLPK